MNTLIRTFLVFVVLSAGLLSGCADSINVQALPPGISDEVLKDLNKSLHLQQILVNELPAMADEPIKIAVQNLSNTKIVLERPEEAVKVFQKDEQANEWLMIDAEVQYDWSWTEEGCDRDGALFELSKGHCSAVFSIVAKPVGDQETYELAIWVLGQKEGDNTSSLTASTMQVFLHQIAPIPEMGCEPHPVQTEGLPSVLMRVWPSPGEKVPLGCYQRSLRGDGLPGIGVKFKALEVYKPETFLPESSTLDAQSQLELYVDGKISRVNKQWSYSQAEAPSNLSREEFWATCSYLQYLPVGNHEVHVRFKAYTGEVTEYTWQFEIVK